MRIWVDADACPTIIKDLLFRNADRLGIALTLVANQPLLMDMAALLQSRYRSSHAPTRSRREL